MSEPLINPDMLGGSTMLTPQPPAPITISDLLNSVEVIRQKEATDKTFLDQIGEMAYETLKQKLLLWASVGFPNVYELHRISISPPALCSDGVSRNLGDYIQFCSGKTINEHVNLLQQKVTGMTISFAFTGIDILIVVSKV